MDRTARSPSPAVEAAWRRMDAAQEAVLRAHLEWARAFLDLLRCGRMAADGCASVGEYGERHGVGAGDARRLRDLAIALEACPELEALILAWRIPLAAAAIVGRVYADPALLRPDDEWLKWAETESERRLKRRLRERREAVRGGKGVVTVSITTTTVGLDDFARSRVLLSRSEGRALTDGETFAALAARCCDELDPLRQTEGVRRVPPTEEVPDSRYVPASEARAVLRRDGDRCVVPYCDHEIFLNLCHIKSHASGGDRERKNLRRNCRGHHEFVDGERILCTGPPEAPVFTTPSGRPMDRRWRSWRPEPRAP